MKKPLKIGQKVRFKYNGPYRFGRYWEVSDIRDDGYWLRSDEWLTFTYGYRIEPVFTPFEEFIEELSQ